MPNRIDSSDEARPSAGTIGKAIPLLWGVSLCALVTLAAVTIQAVEASLVPHAEQVLGEQPVAHPVERQLLVLAARDQQDAGAHLHVVALRVGPLDLGVLVAVGPERLGLDVGRQLRPA